MPEMILDNRIGRRVYAETRRRVSTYWWCSFANDEKFLGVVIVVAIGDRAARRKCRSLGIDPGGEMMAHPIHENDTAPPAIYVNRLLTEEELLAPAAMAVFDVGRARELSAELREIAEDISTIVEDQQP